MADLYQHASVFGACFIAGVLAGWRLEQKIAGRFWKRAR